jgi:cell division septal protein FtsQ
MPVHCIGKKKSKSRRYRKQVVIVIIIGNYSEFIILFQIISLFQIIRFFRYFNIDYIRIEISEPKY